MYGIIVSTLLGSTTMVWHLIAVSLNRVLLGYWSSCAISQSPLLSYPQTDPVQFD